MRAFSTSVISGLQHLLENLARGGLTCSGRRSGIPQTCRTARPEVRSRTQRRGRPSGISAGESSTSSNPMNVSKWGLRPPARVSCRTGLQGYGATGLRKKSLRTAQASSTAPTTEPFSESVRQRPVEWFYQNAGAAVLRVTTFVLTFYAKRLLNRRQSGSCYRADVNVIRVHWR